MPTLHEQFLSTAQLHGEKPALQHKPQGSYISLNYRELAEQVQTCASALINLGVRPAERIAIWSENRPEWVIADLGAMLAGAITVPLHTTFSARLIAQALLNSGSSFLIVSNADHARKIARILPELPQIRKIIIIEGAETPEAADERYLSWKNLMDSGTKETIFPPVSEDDICSLLYTSGTTGDPKGVMLTHRNFLSNAQACLKVIPITERDILLSILPLTHVLERTGGYYAPLVVQGATIAYVKSLKELAANLQEIKPTVLIAVPRLFAALHDRMMQEVRKKGKVAEGLFHWALRQRQRSLGRGIANFLVLRQIRRRFGGRLQLAVSGGAALPRNLAEFFQQIGLVICEGYGLTETAPVISVNPPQRVKVGTVGPPLEGVEVKIAEEGEILVRGPNVTAGYWQDEQATAALIEAAGWLHTGDLGHLDEEGYLTILGRKKELIVTASGKNIWPVALEAKLNSSPFILQSLVVGDNQKHLAALIVPDWTALNEYVQQQGMKTMPPEEIIHEPRVLALYRREIDRVTEDVAEYEKIARFALLTQEFTQEREEITPSLKQARRVIAAHYEKEIRELFHIKEAKVK